MFLSISLTHSNASVVTSNPEARKKWNTSWSR